MCDPNAGGTPDSCAQAPITGMQRTRDAVLIGIALALSISSASATQKPARPPKATATKAVPTATERIDSAGMGVESGIVHSRRLESGVPLGGIGCGSFEIRTDGTISQVAINNNRDKPIQDPPGCFAALWTSSRGRTVTRALQLRNGYELPCVRNLDCLGLFPQAFLEFPDPDLPVKVSIRAFSSLIPHDLKNSSIPAALFVIALTNESRGPIDASVAISWENLLGVGGTATAGPFADRTGNTVTPINSANGIFGLRFDTPIQPNAPPEDRYRYNARGSYALLCEANAKDITVTSASWNALSARPAWWNQFERDGTVAGTVAAGNEATIHPAGVLAMKVSLKDRETRVLPFAIAWHTPRHWIGAGIEYGHYYEKSFDNAVEAATYALNNRLSLGALTDEWQHAILRSSLPPWLSRKLINDSSVLFTNSILTRDSGVSGDPGHEPLVGMIEQTIEGSSKIGDLNHRMLASPLISNWFPELDLRELDEYRARQGTDGSMPSRLGSADAGFLAGPDRLPTETPRPDAQCAWVAQIWRRFRMTGDQPFLDQFYPSAKHALEFAATLDKNAEGIPEGPTVYAEDRTVEDSYTALMWLAALGVGEKMADAMHDRRFAEQCRGWLDKAQARAASLAQDAFRLPPWTAWYAAAGAWVAADAGIDAVADSPALRSYILALLPTSTSPRLLSASPPLTPGILRSWPSHAWVFIAALAVQEGPPESVLPLLDRLNELTAISRSPWRAPLTFNSSTGKPEGAGNHMANPSTWLFLQGLEGFNLNAAERRLVLTPHVPSFWKQLSAPVFTPTIAGWMTYIPGARRSRLLFRVDRYFPGGMSTSTGNTPPGIVISQVVLSSPGAQLPEVTASVNRSPAPGKLTRLDSDRILYTLNSPVTLTAGERIELEIRAP